MRRSIPLLSKVSLRQKRILMVLWLISFSHLIIFGGTINPVTAGEQFQRRTQLNSLLDIANPDINVINDAFELFLFESEQYANTRDNFNSLAEYEAHMAEIFTYMRIKHKFDLMQHLSIDHRPTVGEVVQSGADDGDGRAIFAAALLLYRGHDAWALVGPWHSWAEIILENGTSQQILTKKGIGMKLWYVRFNNKEVNFKPLQSVIYIFYELILAAVIVGILFCIYQVTQSPFMRNVIKSLSIFAIVTGILFIAALVIVLLFYRVIWGV